MKTTLSRVIVAVAALIASANNSFAAIGDVYSLKNDFSTTNNPNVTPLGGTWSFRKASDASLLLPTPTPIGFVSSPGYDPTGGAGGGVPAIWNGFTDLITSVPFDPAVVGSHGDLLIRWQSPENGAAHVTGYYFRDNRDAPPARKLGYILEKNGALVDSQEALAASTKYFFDEILSVATGDTIDLKLVGNFSPGATQPFGGFGGSVVTITMVVPEPVTLGLLLLGFPVMLAFGTRRRREHRDA